MSMRDEVKRIEAMDEDRMFVGERLRLLLAGCCIVCDEPLTSARQVGNSSYGEPCGHRQGQVMVSFVEEMIERRQTMSDGIQGAEDGTD